MQSRDIERVESIVAMFRSPCWVGTILVQDGSGLRSNLTVASFLRIFGQEALENLYSKIATRLNTHLKSQIENHKTKLKELKDKGYAPLSPFEKFKKAGMLEEYRSIYNEMCSYSHNNIRSLIDRFFIIDEKEKNFEIALFKEERLGEYEPYIMTGKHYLRNGSHNIHLLLESGLKDKFPLE